MLGVSISKGMALCVCVCVCLCLCVCVYVCMLLAVLPFSILFCRLHALFVRLFVICCWGFGPEASNASWWRFPRTVFLFCAQHLISIFLPSCEHFKKQKKNKKTRGFCGMQFQMCVCSICVSETKYSPNGQHPEFLDAVPIAE